MTSPFALLSGQRLNGGGQDAVYEAADAGTRTTGYIEPDEAQMLDSCLDAQLARRCFPRISTQHPSHQPAYTSHAPFVCQEPQPHFYMH